MNTETLTNLESLVNRALTSYPGEEARIRRGTALVPSTVLCPNGEAIILSNAHRWTVSGLRCVCPDAALNHAVSGRCKHVWAAALARKLAEMPAEPPLRTLRFFGSVGHDNGEVVVREDGHIEFFAYDEAGIPASEARIIAYHEVALGGRILE